MSTSVKFSLTPMSEIPLVELIDPKKYYFGYRKDQDDFCLGDFAQITIIFNKQKIGRGVELTFEEKYLEVRLCAPSTSADYEIFVELIEKLVKMLNAKEIICEEENLDIAHLDEAYKTAKANMRSALDFIASAPLHTTGPIGILGVFQTINIDQTNQHSIRKGGQAAFNELLYAAQKDDYEKAVSCLNNNTKET